MLYAVHRNVISVWQVLMIRMVLRNFTLSVFNYHLVFSTVYYVQTANNYCLPLISTVVSGITIV